MKKNILRILLCFCLMTIAIGGCGKDSKVTSAKSDREEKSREDKKSEGTSEVTKPSMSEGIVEPANELEGSLREVIEPPAEDFTYNYDAALKGVKITTYSGNAEAIRIPAEIDGEPVKGVSHYEDYTVDFGEMAYIELPDSVTSIGASSFAGCSSLTEITIPDSVTSIGEAAFGWCRSLTEITIPDSVTSIDTAVFRECSSLTEITIPSSVTSIGEGAFMDCSSLTEITIPDGVTAIYGSTFEGCKSLTEITIPNSVTSIGFYAFKGCTNLRNITIPDGANIERSAFNGCEGLTVTYQGQEYNYASETNWWY